MLSARSPDLIGEHPDESGQSTINSTYMVRDFQPVLVNGRGNLAPTIVDDFTKCQHALARYPPDGLENLAIVERIPAERTWVAGRLTELERVEGADIIRGLHFSLRE